MKQAINIRLEKDVVESLDEYAKELDKTRTSLIEKSIELYFDKLDEMVADKRISDLNFGKNLEKIQNIIIFTFYYGIIMVKLKNKPSYKE